MRNQQLRVFVIGAALALSGAATPLAAPPTHLSACATLSAPGAYVLDNDVSTPPSGICFIVTAPNVRLDFQGHKITAGLTGFGVPRIGVSVTTASASGVRITDGTIENLKDLANDSIGIGIRLFSVSDARVTGMTVTGNDLGFYMIDADNGQFSGNTVSGNTNFAFQVEQADDDIFIGNQCANNGSTGVGGCFFLTGSHTNAVVGNTLSNSSVAGVLINNDSSGNDVRRNAITGGQIGVYVFGDSNSIVSNTITGAQSGIVLADFASSNTINRNRVSGSTSYDLSDFGSVCDDTWTNNSFATSSGPSGCIK